MLIDAHCRPRHNPALGLERGEIDMTWEFVTKPVRGRDYVVWEWEWRFTAEDGSTKTSTRSFSSFRECVADARVHGFTGNPDPADSGTTLFHRPESRFNWF
ncbi:MAG: hypothetical protein ACXWCQ_02505 [Burkholderiales bacterium]